MRPIPPKLRAQIAADPFMKRCAICQAIQDITWEHCWIYAGKQINEWWAIIPLCRPHHTGSKYSAEIKGRGRLISLSRATDRDLQKYPKKNWVVEKKYLTKKFYA